jgi:hypothetical protein
MRFEKCTGDRKLVSLLVLLLSMVAAPVGSTRAQEPQMVEKNLFSPERKPVETKSAESKGEPAKMPKGTIQLDGVFLRGDVKRAILRVNPSLLKDKKKKTDPFVTVSENEQLGDYRIIKIEPRSITVEMHGTTFDVSLFAPGKVAPPPARQASAPPAGSPGQGVAPGRPGKGGQPGQPVPGAPGELQPNSPPGPAGDSGNPMAVRGNQGAMQPPAEVDEPDEGAEGQ